MGYGYEVDPGDGYEVDPGDGYEVDPGDGYEVDPGDGYEVDPGDGACGHVVTASERRTSLTHCVYAQPNYENNPENEPFVEQNPSASGAAS